MLFHTFHTPAAYEQLSTASAPYYDSMLHILDDIRDNCTLLILPTGFERAKRVIESWPPRYAIAAQTRLAELRKRRRILNFEDKVSPIGTCALGNHDVCHQVVGQRTDLALVGHSCAACSAIPSVVPIGDYPLSHFSRTRRLGLSFRLAHNQWDKTQFEAKVWEPVFRHATYVKIVDRNLGWYIDRPNSRSNYAWGILWVLQEWNRHAPGQSGTFQIYTSFGRKQVEQHGQGYFEQLLKTWSMPLVSVYPDLTVNVLVEDNADRLPHDRFLLTNQITIEFGRGFDLLDDTNMIRDNTLSTIIDDGDYDAQLSRTDNPFTRILPAHAAH